MNELEKYGEKTFDDIKHVDKNGYEYWLARELMPILQYSNWQNFEKIINKARIACKNSNLNDLNHFRLLTNKKVDSFLMQKKKV